jgi:hypothetical protein
VLAQDKYDMSKFHFVGRLTPADLGKLAGGDDLHIYLTVPFVLSWSMMDAMSCGAVVLGSRPAGEGDDRDGENGLLADFFEPEDFAAKAMRSAERSRGVSPPGPRGGADDRRAIQPRSGAAADAEDVRGRVLSLRQPTPEELEKLETLLQEARSNKKTKRERGRS